MKTALAFAVPATPVRVNAADLRVTVTHGPPGPATLCLAVFDSADAFANHQAVWSQKVEMVEGTAVEVDADRSISLEPK